MNNVFTMSASAIAALSTEEKSAMFDELEQTAVLWIADPTSRKKNQYGYLGILAYDGVQSNAPRCGGRAGAIRFERRNCVSLDWYVGDKEINPDTRDSKLGFTRYWLGYTGVEDDLDMIAEEDLSGIKVVVKGRISKNESIRPDGTIATYYNMKVRSIRPIYDEEAEETSFALDYGKSATKEVYDILKDAWKQVHQYGQYAHESTSEQSQLPM